MDEILDTRSSLLEAAKKLFIESDFESVSIRQLSDLACVNSAMISYYFGSKSGLYNEMISELFWLKKKQNSNIKIDNSNFEVWLKDSLYNFYIFFHQNKDLKKLLVNTLTSKNEDIKFYFIDYFLGRNKSLFLSTLKSSFIKKELSEYLWLNITSITVFPLLNEEVITRLMLKKNQTLEDFYLEYSISTSKTIKSFFALES